MYAIPEQLRGVITTRRYTNPHLPILYLTMSVFKDFQGLENMEKNSRTFKDRHEPWTSSQEMERVYSGTHTHAYLLTCSGPTRGRHSINGLMNMGNYTLFQIISVLLCI